MARHDVGGSGRHLEPESRPEDRNSVLDYEEFPGGATLRQLQIWVNWLADVEEAPGDSHPAFSLNARGEIEGAVCVKRRAPDGMPDLIPVRPSRTDPLGGPLHAPRHARPASSRAQDEQDWLASGCNGRDL
jgi:hypothetical protein